MSKIFKQTLDAMPDIFTSAQFISHAKELGITQKALNNKGMSKFILRNGCSHCGSIRIYRKKNAVKSNFLSKQHKRIIKRDRYKSSDYLSDLLWVEQPLVDAYLKVLIKDKEPIQEERKSKIFQYDNLQPGQTWLI